MYDFLIKIKSIVLDNCNLLVNNFCNTTFKTIKCTKNRKNLNLCTVYNFQAQLAEYLLFKNNTS